MEDMQNIQSKLLNTPGLEEVRKTLREKIIITPQISEEMSQTVRRQEALVDSLLRAYTLYDNGVPMRLTLGNEMQIMYMRERQTLSFLLFPELLKLEYEVARVIGDVFIAPMMRGKTLPEILNSNQPIAAAHRYAHEEIVVAREDFGIYRHYECADCYGLPNIGMKICAYEAGTAAGCFAKPLGRPVEVIETKCCANGDPYCEFEIHVG